MWLNEASKAKHHSRRSFQFDRNAWAKPIITRKYQYMLYAISLCCRWCWLIVHMIVYRFYLLLFSYFNASDIETQIWITVKYLLSLVHGSRCYECKVNNALMMHLDWNKNVFVSGMCGTQIDGRIDGQCLMGQMSRDNFYGQLAKMASKHLLIILIQNRNVNGSGTMRTVCALRILPFVFIHN